MTAKLQAIQKSLQWIRPSEKNTMDFHADEVLTHLNVHQLGTVQSFNPANQTASATIDSQKVQYVHNPQTGLDSQQLVAYPPLTGCPVLFLCGKKGGMTFPLSVGDKCDIWFNDRDMDLWYAGGIGQAPPTGRLHDFSDAIIVVGANPPANPLANFSTQYVMLRNGAGTSFVGIDVTNGKISIQNPAQNVATLIQNLISEIQGMTIVVTGGSGVVSPTDQANLAAIAAKFGQVLE